MFVIADFRNNFPEFANVTVYPDAQLTFWATVAQKMVNQCVWLDMYDTGVQLYVAHEITLAAINAKAVAVGGNPGGFSGAAASKAVGAVNVSYDTNTTSEKDAGFWNLTSYGKQFYRLMMIFGAGCVQL